MIKQNILEHLFFSLFLKTNYYHDDLFVEGTKYPGSPKPMSNGLGSQLEFRLQIIDSILHLLPVSTDLPESIPIHSFIDKYSSTHPYYILCPGLFFFCQLNTS